MFLILPPLGVAMGMVADTMDWAMTGVAITTRRIPILLTPSACGRVGIGTMAADIMKETAK